jgi:predicted GH43/DUF377 family glycosyl hydrolase
MRVKLVRSPKNPIIEPKREMVWESGATFNPGAVKTGEITHILYRAVNERSISSLGHTTTTDGETILDRSLEPVLRPAEPWEKLGCEDPRITALDGTFYVFYTAYSRHNPPEPILEPEEDYERVGVVPNVVFPAGAVVIKDDLRSFTAAQTKSAVLRVFR